VTSGEPDNPPVLTGLVKFQFRTSSKPVLLDYITSLPPSDPAKEEASNGYRRKEEKRGGRKEERRQVKAEQGTGRRPTRGRSDHQQPPKPKPRAHPATGGSSGAPS